MRHGVKRFKLNRNKGERKALLRSLAIALFMHERIVTTHAKARIVKPFADHLISQAKKDNVTARRLLLSRLPNETAVEKLLKDLAPRFADRTSGFSRIVSLGKRKSDASDMARIELITQEIAVDKKKKAPSEGKAVKAALPAISGKGTKVKTQGKVTGPERKTRSQKEKAVSRRQVSVRREGKK